MYTAPGHADIVVLPRCVGESRLSPQKNKPPTMRELKKPSSADRQKAAKQARQDILNKFRSQPGPDDPAVKQRQAEREALATERTKAKLAREAEKAEQKRRE